MRTIERVFEFKGYDDHGKYKVAILKLKGYASLWYETLKMKRRKEGKPPIKSWETLKKKLIAKFVGPNYTQDLFIKLTKLEQGSQSVEAYLREFEQLTLQCEVEEKEELRIARFLEGLDPRISSLVKLQPLWSFEDVVNVALKVEKNNKTKILHLPTRTPYTRALTPMPTRTKETKTPS